MRVVDDDDKPVAWDGEAFGELLVRGPSVVEEYYDRPEADATDFVAADDGGRGGSAPATSPPSTKTGTWRSSTGSRT